MPKYDLAIIGSGPGGYVTAIRASQWGLKTVVIEKDGYLGGTCLHVGCIPTKVLLYHAEIYDHFKNAKEFGIEVKDFKLNWPAVLARKDKIIKKHAKGIEFLFRKNKVETLQGWGRWAGPGKVAVERTARRRKSKPPTFCWPRAPRRGRYRASSSMAKRFSATSRSWRCRASPSR